MESLKLQRMTSLLLRPRSLIAWVIIVALVRFINLGFLDLQGWDEGLHALRSKSILQFGEWLDQTPYVPGGLATSCYPPLTFWTTAAFYKIFGPGEFTTRLTAALFGAASVLLIVLLARRFVTQSTASIVGIVLGTNLFYTFFTRQGQLDIPYVFFLLLSTYGWLLWNENGGKTLPLRGFICVAVGTWGAFMSKILVGFYVPMVLLLVQAWEMRGRWKWRSFGGLCLAIGVGILLALPWHIFMYVKHGSAFVDAFLGLHFLQRFSSPIEGHHPSLGILFHLNQLVVQYPESALGIGLLAFLLGKKSGGVIVAPQAVSISTVWSVVVLMVITAMATKIPQYILPLSVPVSLLGGIALGLFAEGRLQRRSSLALIALFSITTAWSALWPVRAYLKTNVLGLAESSPHVNIPWAMVVICVVTIGYGIYLAFHRAPASVEHPAPLFVVVVLVLFTLRAALEVAVNDRMQYNIGTKKVADIVREQGAQRVVYVGKDLNPALDLYLKGWKSWREDVRLNFYLSEATALAPRSHVIDPPLPGEVTILVEERRLDDMHSYANLDSLTSHSSILFSNSTYRVSMLSPMR